MQSVASSALRPSRVLAEWLPIQHVHQASSEDVLGARGRGGPNGWIILYEPELTLDPTFCCAIWRGGFARHCPRFRQRHSLNPLRTGQHRQWEGNSVWSPVRPASAENAVRLSKSPHGPRGIQ